MFKEIFENLADFLKQLFLEKFSSTSFPTVSVRFLVSSEFSENSYGDLRKSFFFTNRLIADLNIFLICYQNYGSVIAVRMLCVWGLTALELATWVTLLDGYMKRCNRESLRPYFRPMTSSEY